MRFNPEPRLSFVDNFCAAHAPCHSLRWSLCVLDQNAHRNGIAGNTLQPFSSQSVGFFGSPERSQVERLGRNARSDSGYCLVNPLQRRGLCHLIQIAVAIEHGEKDIHFFRVVASGIFGCSSMASPCGAVCLYHVRIEAAATFMVVASASFPFVHVRGKAALDRGSSPPARCQSSLNQSRRREPRLDRWRIRRSRTSMPTPSSSREVPSSL